MPPDSSVQTAAPAHAVAGPPPCRGSRGTARSPGCRAAQPPSRSGPGRRRARSRLLLLVVDVGGVSLLIGFHLGGGERVARRPLPTQLVKSRAEPIQHPVHLAGLVAPQGLG